MTDYGPIKLSPDTVYHHITHWKAGSQWFLAVLKAAFDSAVIEPENRMRHVLSRLAQPGKIYPCCYMPRRRYDGLKLPEPARRIVIIRDLRDTLVSGYFSLRDTHDVNDWVSKWRPILKARSIEDGLIFLMDQWLLASADIQSSWLTDGEVIARLEDFMSQPAESLQSALSAGWGLTISIEHARSLMWHHSFEHHSGGRKPGEEDTASHYRKGVRGDWRAHFTPRVVDEFKARYNGVLLRSGYETSPNWSCESGTSA